MQRRLNSGLSAAFLDAVRSQLRIAKTYCDLVPYASGKGRRKLLMGARKAVDLAEEYMSQVQMADKQFDQLTANVERVKFALRRYEKDDSGGG